MFVSGLTVIISILSSFQRRNNFSLSLLPFKQLFKDKCAMFSTDSIIHLLITGYKETCHLFVRKEFNIKAHSRQHHIQVVQSPLLSSLRNIYLLTHKTTFPNINEELNILAAAVTTQQDD